MSRISSTRWLVENSHRCVQPRGGRNFGYFVPSSARKPQSWAEYQSESPEETQLCGLPENLLVHLFPYDLITAMDRPKGETVTRRRALRSFVILLFSTTWLIALITGWAVPRFGGEDSAGAKTIDRIRWSTGTRQQWDMFHTIPNMRGYRMDLIGETMSGERRTFGAIVPKLEAFNGTRAVRYDYAFSRIVNERQEFLDGYIAQVAKALRRQDPEVERFSIHIVWQPTRLLEHSRKDGNLWTTVSQNLGPYPVNDD